MDCNPPGPSIHGISQRRILEWGCHFLLQGIFLTRGSNPCLLHRQVDSLLLSHQEAHVSPKKDLKQHSHSSQVWVRWCTPHPSLRKSLEQRQKFLPFGRNCDGLKGQTQDSGKEMAQQKSRQSRCLKNYRVFTLSPDSFPSLFFGKEKIFCKERIFCCLSYYHSID